MSPAFAPLDNALFRAMFVRRDTPPPPPANSPAVAMYSPAVPGATYWLSAPIIGTDASMSRVSGSEAKAREAADGSSMPKTFSTPITPSCAKLAGIAGTSARPRAVAAVAPRINSPSLSPRVSTSPYPIRFSPTIV